MPCSNAAKTRNPLKFAGVPQTTGWISAVSRPKFTILWGHVEDISLLNKFFPIVDMCLSCEDIVRQSCATVPRWRFLATFCVLHFLHFQRAACSRFQTCILNSHLGTPCVEVWQTSNLRRLRLGEERKKEEEKITGQKYNGLPYYIGQP